MKKGPNMHPIDRVVRLIVGVSCVYIGFIDSSLISSRLVATVVGIFGIINLWAFITTRCPVYSAAGFSTATKKKEESTST
jgi:uncharacterized membrane protein YuzA (DUF378 family)